MPSNSKTTVVGVTLIYIAFINNEDSPHGENEISSNLKLVNLIIHVFIYSFFSSFFFPLSVIVADIT